MYAKCGQESFLAHSGWVTHICVGKLTIIASDDGVSPVRRQAIIWTSAGILLIGSLGTNFSEHLITIHVFSFKQIHLKMSSGKWRPSCLGFNVIKVILDTLGIFPIGLSLWFHLNANPQFSTNLSTHNGDILTMGHSQRRKSVPSTSGWSNTHRLQLNIVFWDPFYYGD